MITFQDAVNLHSNKIFPVWEIANTVLSNIFQFITKWSIVCVVWQIIILNHNLIIQIWQNPGRPMGPLGLPVVAALISGLLPVPKMLMSYLNNHWAWKLSFWNIISSFKYDGIEISWFLLIFGEIGFFETRIFRKNLYTPPIFFFINLFKTS